MKISCTTPSVRPEGLQMVKDALEAQDFPREDFEWIVCSPFKYEGADKWIEERPKREGDFYNLTKAFNDLFKAASGDLIISVVDLIWFPADTLSNFWLHYDANPNACVGGIGHQYEKEVNGIPEILVWKDPRARLDQGSFYEIYPIDLELCLTSIPRQGILDVGGMDESYDQVAALGEKDMCLRMEKLGYKFFLDQSLEYKALRHPRLNGEKVWDEHYQKGCKMFDEKMAGLRDGTRSVNVGYIKDESI